MKFSPDGSKVGVALNEGGSPSVEIFTFVDSTLALVNPLQIDLSGLADPGQEVYGLEFSPGGTKLWVTLTGPAGSKLVEFRVDSLDQEFIQASGQVIAEEDGEEWGALQIGPDGQVYMARNGQGFLGTFQPVEDTLQTATLNLQGQDLGGATSTLGLPNFIQSIFRSQGQPGISVSEAQCVGTEVSFAATPTSQIDEFQWTIRNRSNNSIIHSSAEQEFTFVFDSVGIYDITLEIFNRCGLDTTLLDTVNIAASPEPPTFDPAMALCDDDLEIDADNTNTPGLTFLWSTGETTKTITVDQPGFYDVTITNAAGCTSTGDVQVGDARPQIEIGPDQTICQNDPVQDLDANIGAGAQYQWSINGNAAGTNRFQPVNTSNSGNFEYVLQVTDPFNGCIARDTTTFTVNPQPSLDTAQHLVVTDDDCDPNTGTGSIDISNDPNSNNYTINWSSPGNTTNFAPGPAIAGLNAGVYNMEVADPVSGCLANYPVTIRSDTPPNFTLTDQPDCEVSQFEVNLNPGSIPNFRFEVIDGSGQVVDQGTSPNTNFTTNLINPGTYTVELTDGNNCVNSAQETLTVLPEVDYTLNIIGECINNAEISASSTEPNTTFTWQSGTTLIGTGTTINPIPSFDGDITLNVQDNTGNFCPADTTFAYRVNPDPLVVIDVTGDECDGEVTLTANVTNAGPNDNFSYSWTNLGDPPIRQRPLVANPNRPTTNVEVQVQNQLTGCVGDASNSVTVYPPIDINIIGSQACDNGQPSILLAQTNLDGLTFDWIVPGGVRIPQDTSAIEAFNEGTYRVNATIATCTETATFNVRFNPADESGLDDRYIFCSQDPDPDQQIVVLDPSGNFVTYLWEGENTGTTIRGPQAVITEEDIYYATLTNSFGCVTRDTVEVLDDCVPRVFVPTAFSPNGDNNNEVFTVVPLYVQDFEVFIYNRWGELIFYSDSQDFNWDGTVNGTLSPTGTYAYMMRYRSITDPNRGVLEKRGGVLLIR
jgi:gliding motility-associated-like protein